MTTTTTAATGNASFTSWAETPEPAPHARTPRLAQATVSFAYDGDLTGRGTCHYVLRYGPDGSGDFVGFEQVTGRLHGREGTFTLRHQGTFDAQSIVVQWTVVAGSATGQFDGLTGSGGFVAGEGARTWPWRLAYDG